MALDILVLVSCFLCGAMEFAFAFGLDSALEYIVVGDDTHGGKTGWMDGWTDGWVSQISIFFLQKLKDVMLKFL